MSTTLTFVVNVGSNPPVQLLHGPKVEVDGDLDSLNNTASDTTAIAHPVVTLVTALDLVPGQQQSLDLRLPAAFPYDISGTLKVAFAQNAVNPADDPAIQFETGGREVQFTIPANTVQAVFGNNPSSRPLLFQAGTVAGTLTFSGTLQTGSLQTPFSITREIARQAPIVQRIETDTRNGFAASITVISTLREITDVYLSFETTPPVQLTCGNTFGCVLFSGSLLRLITKTLFDPWFVRDSTFGGLSTVRIPLSIRGSVEGVVRVTLYNRMGASNTMSFQLP
jgi:hypothetical protein